jgi:hypothetical protein
MIHRRVRIGVCKTCGSDVMSYQVFLDDPNTIRGIQLAWVSGDTGYWAACSNKTCPHHWGEGTLPQRPRNMFEDDKQRSPEAIKKDLDARARCQDRRSTTRRLA